MGVSQSDTHVFLYILPHPKENLSLSAGVSVSGNETC